MIGDTNASSGASQETVLDITVTGENVAGGTITVKLGDQLVAEDLTDSSGKCKIGIGLTYGQVTVSYVNGSSEGSATINAPIGMTTLVSVISAPPPMTFTMEFSATDFVSSPDTCLTYADDCAGFTPVSGPGSSGSTPAKCTTIGSWEMNADGTSDNPLLDRCFYATFTDAGVLHEKLNPQNLAQKIATWNGSEWVSASGTSSITSENTMFCIPTIYVSSTSSSVTISTKESTGTAFAHTIDDHVYEYMAIAVYPGNGSSSRIRSISGATSTVSITQANLVAGCKANTVNNGKAMLCNWHQWSLYRLLVLFAMRHFNSQAKIGQGGQTYGAKTTGLMNAMGLFAGSSSTTTGTTQGVKAFIENPWGHNWEYLGDIKYLSSGVYVFQTSTQSPTSTTGGTCISTSPHSLTSPGLSFGNISTQPMTWGWGTGSGGSATTGGCDYQYLPSSGNPFAIVGGASGYVSNGLAGVSYVNNTNGSASGNGGGRSVFVFDL